MKTTKYHYGILQKFNERYYSGLLHENNLVEEIVIDEQPFWYALKNQKKYLLTREQVSDLPFKVLQTDDVHYSKKVYYLITRYQSVKIKQEKLFTFRELVNEIADFKHSHPREWTLFKICALSSYLSRVNFRVSTEAAFGKDSMFLTIGMLRNDSCVINPRSMAALEYRLFNRVLVLDEISNMESSQKDLLQEFLLLIGDFRNVYEKGTRAVQNKTKDTYDISKLSVVILFNILDYYKKVGAEKKFFDNVFTKAVTDRFLPLKFEGTLDIKQFDNKTNLEEQSKEHTPAFIKVIRTLEYYKVSWEQEQKTFTHNKESFASIKGRWGSSFDNICKFINLYSKDQKEYDDLVQLLYEKVQNYARMLKEEQSVFSKFTELEVQEELIK